MIRAPHKYRARKTVVDGIAFASGREAKRYAELKLMEKAGVIEALCCQPRYELQPAFSCLDGTKIRKIDYIADFSYTENGVQVVEDCKGFRTKDYLIKRKMFLFKYQHLRHVES